MLHFSTSINILVIPCDSYHLCKMSSNVYVTIFYTKLNLINQTNNKFWYPVKSSFLRGGGGGHSRFEFYQNRKE